MTPSLIGLTTRSISFTVTASKVQLRFYKQCSALSDLRDFWRRKSMILGSQSRRRCHLGQPARRRLKSHCIVRQGLERRRQACQQDEGCWVRECGGAGSQASIGSWANRSRAWKDSFVSGSTMVPFTLALYTKVLRKDKNTSQARFRDPQFSLWPRDDPSEMLHLCCISC